MCQSNPCFLTNTMTVFLEQNKKNYPKIALFIVLSYLTAIASISSNTSFGSLATSTQLLAGNSDVKYS